MVHHCRFDRLYDAMEAFSVPSLSGALFDLGVSSPQLDERMAALHAGKQPGHYGSWAEMSAPLWPVPTVLS